MIFGLFKKKEVEKPKYTYETFKLMDQDYDYNEKFGRKHKDELNENDDYSMSKKDMIEYASGRVYKFLPENFPCSIVDDKVFDEDNHYIGRIKKTDLKQVKNALECEITFYDGHYKVIRGGDLERGQANSYFVLEIKIGGV